MQNKSWNKVENKSETKRPLPSGTYMTEGEEHTEYGNK